MARCSSCGHESDLDTFVCDNCGYQLKVEKIESIPIFTRPQERWFKPDPFYLRLAKSIYRPTYAFRDINKKKDNWGPRFIRFLCAFFTGLWVVAILTHVRTPDNTFLQRTLVILPLFFVFFLFGIIYWRLVFWFYSFLYSLAANFSVQLDGILMIRYNVKVKSSAFRDFVSGRGRLRRQKEGELSLEAITEEKGLTKISQTGKSKLMTYAYVPFVIANLITFLVIIIGLPSVDIGSFASFDSTTFSTTMNTLWDATFVWQFVDILQILAVLWSAVLMSLALREIGNTNTTRILIGNFVIAFIIIYTTIFLRPTLGWNLNIIDRLG